MRKGITVGNIIADKGAFTKSLYPGSRESRKWNIISSVILLENFREKMKIRVSLS